MCNSNELRAVSHSWEVGAKRSDMLIERQRYVGPGGGRIAMGLEHGPGTRGTENERAHRRNWEPLGGVVRGMGGGGQRAGTLFVIVRDGARR